ncbi:MAG: Ig-like domain-containing protein [Flavobacteriales bacterium]
MNSLRITYFILLLLCTACAQQRGLTGGDKDVTPPTVLATSPAMLTTGFSTNGFQIEFDEYIGLNNIAQELIISPPLQKQPEVKIRQKRLIVEWKEALQPNTTYTFNFGDGVADVNENNKAVDLVYVFSTGDMIDSLQLTGNVHDALNDTPAKGFKVLAYKEDTTIFSKKPRPAYFTKSKEDGSFKLDYMRSDALFLYALDDVNGNYRYDQGEAIAMLGTPAVPIANDSSNHQLNASIPLSVKPVVDDYDTDSTGFFRFAFDANRYNGYSIVPLNGLEYWNYTSPNSDTVYVALKGAPTNRMEQVAIGWKEINTMTAPWLLADTIEVPFFSEVMQSSFALRCSAEKKIKVSDIILISADMYLQLQDKDKVELLADTLPITAELTAYNHAFEIVTALKQGVDYKLTVLPGALMNGAGATNDTLEVSFHTYKQTDLGNIIFDFKLPDDDIQYLLQLKSKSGDVIDAGIIQSGKKIMSDIPPGEYTASVLADENHNFLFDPCTVNPFQQSEQMHIYKGTIQVRANWDVKIDWELKPR